MAGKSVRVTLSIDDISVVLVALFNNAIDTEESEVERHRQAYNKFKRALERNGYTVKGF